MVLYFIENESVIIKEALPELRFVFGHHTDLQLSGFEVQRQHRGQTRYGQLQRQPNMTKKKQH